VVTFIITLAITALISVIITRKCYKCQQLLNERVKTDNVFENNQFVLNQQDDCQVENPVYGSRVQLKSNPSYHALNQVVKKQ